MKRVLLISAMAVGLAACNQSASQQRVATGAAVGALGGAAVGGVLEGTEGAAIGGVTGAIGGAAIAGATAPDDDCYAYDDYGRRIAVRCP
jgi:uncharacterized membrane protein